MDQARAEAAVKELLLALDQDVSIEGLRDTPKRVAKMYIEHCTAVPEKLDRTFGEERFDELVSVRDIPFVSCCAHHMVFFSGRAHIGYLPTNDKLLGLSKLVRLLYSHCKGFTTQEAITSKVADQLEQSIKAKGVIVVLNAVHGCMTHRGVRAVGSSTVTSAVRGAFRDVPAARSEFFALLAIQTK